MTNEEKSQMNNPTWTVTLAHTFYDEGEVAFMRSCRGKTVAIGDIERSLVTHIGPIEINHDEWYGEHLNVTPEQAKWIGAACRAYQKKKPFPEDNQK